MRATLTLCSVFLLGAFHATAAKAQGPNINVSIPTKVPGMTLQPGIYSIHVVGKMSDRVILKVDDGSGKTNVDFIGIPDHALKGPPGVVSWSQPVGGTTYLRGWVPPGSSSLIEFVYPKEEAVSIATVNREKVPAIDPASEGRKADPSLSKEDMKLTTLWLLSSTQVGPSDSKPSIKAERYQTASYVQPKAPIAALPHTAGSLPIVLLASLLSLAGAILLRWRRLTSSRSEQYSQV